MKKNSFQNRHKPGDYVGTCDTCGQYFWASHGKILDKYTGLGGSWVCPNCKDKIHYGFVPYTVDPEEPVPIARNSGYLDQTQPTVTIDFTKCPPVKGS